MTRLPRAPELPWNYAISVVRGDCGDSWGLWDEDARVITLDPSLRVPAQARYIFLHEFDHAYADWKKWVRDHIGIQNPDGPAEELAGEDNDD